MSIMGLELHGECSGICGSKTYQSNACGVVNTVTDFCSERGAGPDRVHILVSEGNGRG